MAKILIPIPRRDFDPSEVSISWKVLSEKGHQISFATPAGIPGIADQRMLTGKGLGPFQSMKANPDAISAYEKMVKSTEFQSPLKWEDCAVENFDTLVLPGGHAPGMREYLESEVLQKIVAEFFRDKKIVGAICHGVVLAARSKDPATGRSVLFEKKTTALPAWMEMSAWAMTALWLGNYYRTYPKTVQTEVTENLKNPEDFLVGPKGLKRDSLTHLEFGFVVKDENYISARWPGDAHCFANEVEKSFKTTNCT